MAVMKVEYTADGFAIITMQNGENRLNQTFINEMTKILDDIERNKDVKAVITTGEGKFYSNGLDLKWMTSETEDVVNNFRKNLGNLQWRLTHFPLPTVALLNGHTFAGGAFIAAAHDYRVMNSKRGWICWNEVHLNLRLAQDALDLLRYKFGHMAAIREAVLFAKRVPAKTAVELGIVDLAVEPDNLLKEAKQMAIKALGPNGIDRGMLQTMKKDLYPRLNAKLISISNVQKHFVSVGHAFAGGAFIAAAHDYRVMNSKRGWICWNELHLKLGLAQDSLDLLRYKFNHMTAMREAVLFAKRVPAQTAVELGIVDLAVEPDNLLKEAKQMAIKALGPNGIDRGMLQTMKKDLYPRLNAKL
ncbi:enoyl-CoA delta isomerase 3-like [Pecten maximus]|uniref:enoyl-CoA delta isomerase 3-like n=1 Tax=Pecten maximus TaxID=6579 RepID=UPI001458DF24|nr:enoyl-CoA delta isomerase 3-like [Pecten maximus]